MPETDPHADWKPKYNPWLITVVVALAAFMEILDTSIANVALPSISGSLGASQDQGTWVLTTYLVANAIVLPISGWITSIIGRKRFFLICIALFTGSSILCGLAPSLPFLLLARALQGMGGGGLQPMAQAIMADVFPPEKRGIAFSVFGLTAVVAPALGPTLGGWITDNYSWHWIFLINVPVGLFALAAVFQLVEDPPFLNRKRLGESRFDYLGFSALALGIAALQIVLDKGQEEDWLASHFILVLAITALVCLSFLILWEWFEKDPIVDVRLFRFFNFSTSTFMMFIIGIVYFSSTILMPQFLQTLMGYTAQKAGVVVSLGALLLLVEMPIVGFLTSKFPAKFMMAFGWLALSAGLYFSVKVISLDISFESAAFIMALQYLPLAFLFIPASTAAYIGVPRDKSDSVAGLINFARNIGSSVGTSLAQTMLVRKAQLHQDRLTAHTALGDPSFQSALDGVANLLKSQSGVSDAEAQTGALAQIYRSLQAQASVLSYMDTYFLLAAAAAAMFLLSFVLAITTLEKRSNTLDINHSTKPHVYMQLLKRNYFSIRRVLLASLALSILLRAQQQPQPGQLPQAQQLPASGRTTQTTGLVGATQSTAPGQGASVVQPSVQVSGAYAGSVPAQELPGGDISLSLSDAVKRGLTVNLGSITAANSSMTARAQRAQALSQLLPQISASLGATETQVNLAAYGLNTLGGSIPGFRSVVGPFHYVQAQGNLTWNAFSLTQIRNHQASQELERASGFDLRNARELVVLAVGGTYLQVIAAAARVDSQKTQVAYAQAVFDQSASQLAAGTTTRIDNTRSRVQLQTEQERLIAYDADYQQQKIALARLIGVPTDRRLILTEPFGYRELQPIGEDEALHTALGRRSDLQAAAAQVKAAERVLAASRAERYPTVSASGDYGAIGVNPNSAHGVFTATGSVNIPIYTGGRIKADMLQAQATLSQRQSEYQDQKGMVDQDVRNALIQLRTAIGQARLAESNRAFALETLTQARDRFAAGVTNTVEVVQAQQQQSSAEYDYVSSLFAFNLARLTLARATGEAEATVGALFTGSRP